MKTISERVTDLVPELVAKHPSLREAVIADLAIMRALDAWQASVERRLDDLEEEVLAKALAAVVAEPGPSVDLGAEFFDPGPSKYDAESDR